MGNIEYCSIKVKDLPDYIEDFLSNADGQEFAPITPERALSQAANPSATGDEIGLILALDGKRVVGYLGVIY